MVAKKDAFRDELGPLLEAALEQTEPALLEQYLIDHAKLAPTFLNLPMAHAFADLIGEDTAHITQAESMLDTWAALDPEQVPVNDAREILPAAALLSYGQIAVSCRDEWDEVVAKLHAAASDSRWRMREMVAAAWQRMLAADWDRAYKTLTVWMADSDPLVIRAAAAAVAEPPLLTSPQRSENALAIQAGAAKSFGLIPAARRHEENVGVLRQGLAYTLSVAIAAVPESGFALLEKLASSRDKDIRWIVRENLTKKRLQAWPERVQKIQSVVSKSVASKGKQVTHE